MNLPTYRPYTAQFEVTVTACKSLSVSISSSSVSRFGKNTNQQRQSMYIKHHNSLTVLDLLTYIWFRYLWKCLWALHFMQFKDLTICDIQWTRKGNLHRNPIILCKFSCELKMSQWMKWSWSAQKYMGSCFHPALLLLSSHAHSTTTYTQRSTRGSDPLSGRT